MAISFPHRVFLSIIATQSPFAAVWTIDRNVNDIIQCLLLQLPECTAQELSKYRNIHSKLQHS